MTAPLVLVIQTSGKLEGSYSRLLVGEAVTLLRSRAPASEVKTRDLLQTPIPHVDSAFVAAYSTPVAEYSAEHRAASRFSEELIAELKWARLVILGVPMYQAGIPSVLKAWFDHVLRVGFTIKRTPQGREGLLKDRRVLGILTRGGVHETDAGGDGLDFQRPYLAQIFGLMGMETDFVLCEGTGNAALLDKNLAAARIAISGHPWLCN